MLTDEIPGEADWPCDMRYQPPFDFAWCETHDKTFALGDVCPFEKRRQEQANRG